LVQQFLGLHPTSQQVESVVEAISHLAKVLDAGIALRAVTGIMGARHYHKVFLRTSNAPKFAFAAIICAGTCAGGVPQTGSRTEGSLPTEVRVKNPGWWPTKGEAARGEYVGAEACAKCHDSIVASYGTAAMAHAAAPGPLSEGLRQHDRLNFQWGPFSYQILTSSAESVLSVSDGTRKLSRTLTWAFGERHMGQTYVFEDEGTFYEAHLSFFTSLGELDITPGQHGSTSVSLQDAAGRRMDRREAQRCFGCHTTASTVNEGFDPHNSILGVTCEACHGPGAKHLAALSLDLEDNGAKQILNPARLDPVASVDFCGACHRTWEDVVQSGGVGMGVLNVRFAPYRLLNSRCWMNGDARITCVACHDPHKRLVTDAASYDPVCLRCHVLWNAKENPDHPGAACPVAEANCVTCHMPKYEPPGFHSRFTDHWIRVAQPAPSYPN
jgi:Cytochrome c554 and c-prime